MHKHTVLSTTRLPNLEVCVIMATTRVWFFRRGLTGKIHLGATGIDQPSRHPEYRAARKAAEKALAGCYHAQG